MCGGIYDSYLVCVGGGGGGVHGGGGAGGHKAFGGLGWNLLENSWLMELHFREVVGK